MVQYSQAKSVWLIPSSPTKQPCASPPGAHSEDCKGKGKTMTGDTLRISLLTDPCITMQSESFSRNLNGVKTLYFEYWIIFRVINSYIYEMPRKHNIICIFNDIRLIYLKPQQRHLSTPEWKYNVNWRHYTDLETRKS